jgi:hypothetical protein
VKKAGVYDPAVELDEKFCVGYASVHDLSENAEIPARCSSIRSKSISLAVKRTYEVHLAIYLQDLEANEV